MPRTSLQTVETLTTTLPPLRLLALRGSLASHSCAHTHTRARVALVTGTEVPESTVKYVSACACLLPFWRTYGIPERRQRKREGERG